MNIRAGLPMSAVGVLLTAGFVSAQAGVGIEPQATFRSTVDLVTLHVTVTDQSGRHVSDLVAGDFTILEDGRPQELRLFEPGGLPLAVMLLLDISSSMHDVFPEAQSAAIQFMQRLRPQDTASVMSFADRADILQKFTDDRQALERAVRRAEPHGSTRLYNALYVGLTELGRFSAGQRTPRRRVLVLLTDGRDTRSLVSFDAVLDVAKRSNIAIYAIRILRPDVTQANGGKPEFVLRQLTTQTGGRAFLSVRQGKDLRPLYDDIRAELAAQFAIGYVSNDTRRDGRFRRLSVQVKRPSVQARTRSGYFAPLARKATGPGSD